MPLAGEKQEQHTAAITRTQHDRLEGKPQSPPCAVALPNWRARSLAAGLACCLPVHVSLYDSSSGLPGDSPLVLSARQLARCAHLVRAPPCRLPPGRCLAVRCTVAVCSGCSPQGGSVHALRLLSIPFPKPIGRVELRLPSSLPGLTEAVAVGGCALPPRATPPLDERWQRLKAVRRAGRLDEGRAAR